MSSCKTIKKYEGENKSTKIMEMINNKIKEGLKKNLPELRKNKELVKAYTKFLKIKEEKDKARKHLEEIKKKLGLKWSYLYEKIDGKSIYDYEIDETCRVPCTTIERLQKAQNLWTLGKTKEAQQEWEQIIQDYKLFE